MTYRYGFHISICVEKPWRLLYIKKSVFECLYFRRGVNITLKRILQLLYMQSNKQLNGEKPNKKQTNKNHKTNHRTWIKQTFQKLSTLFDYLKRQPTFKFRTFSSVTYTKDKDMLKCCVEYVCTKEKNCYELKHIALKR